MTWTRWSRSGPRCDGGHAALAALGLAAEFEVEVPPASWPTSPSPASPWPRRCARRRSIAEEIASAMILGAGSRRSGRTEVTSTSWSTQNCSASRHWRSSSSKEDYGRSEAKGVKVLLEHTSVNPTGPIHVGGPATPSSAIPWPAACGTVTTSPPSTLSTTWANRWCSSPGAWRTSRTLRSGQPTGRRPTIAWSDTTRRPTRSWRRTPRWRSRWQDAAPLRGRRREVIEQVAETAELMLDGIREPEAVNVIGQLHLGVTVHQRRFSKGWWSGSRPALLPRGGRSVLPGPGGLRDPWQGHPVLLHPGDGTTLYTTRDMAYHLDKFSRADRLINVLGEDQKLGRPSWPSP